jgi:spore coat protein A, manganese oxidase
MRVYLLVLLTVFFTNLKAQTPLLDAVAHPKYQFKVPSPTKINLSTTSTNIIEMAQTTQSLGLINPLTNARFQTKVWGYGPVGAPSYPGPTLVANSNIPVNVEWRNNLPATHFLPVDSTYHIHLPTIGVPTVVHLHGGHTEADSDGNPDAWFGPNFTQKGHKWIKKAYTYDNNQQGATLWYHDHALGATRLNVFGSSGFLSFERCQ